MKRTVKYALSAVMTAALVVPVLAQDNFPDTPENHWAFDALSRMKKEGILVGFPDGKYRGARPATRYELAVAINAVYNNIKGITDGLATQIKAIDDKMSGSSTGSADLDNLRASLKELQDQVNGMKAYGQDIADLKKMADKFEKDLASIGVDVDEMKKNLSDLDKRVSALEAKKFPIDVHGDLSAVVLAGYSSSGLFGIGVDGRQTGVGRGSYAGVPSGVGRDLTVLHEGAIQIDSTNETGPKFSGTFVMGNMLGANGNSNGFGSQSLVYPGSSFLESNNEIYIQNLSVSFAEKVAGLSFDAAAGRIGVKLSPYIFQRPDTTPYFSNDRWDNGKWNFDGAMVAFSVGTAKLTVMGGRTSDQKTQDGTLISPMLAGTSQQFVQGGARPIGFGNIGLVDQLLGANVMIPISDRGSVDVSYLLLDSNTLTLGANRVTVFGGTAKFNVSGVKLSGGYAKTDAKLNNSSVNTSNNTEYHVNVGFGPEKYGINVGYRNIDPFYGAPGDWGRLGIWWNPTDIRGFTAKAHVALSDKLYLHGSGEFYTGTGELATGLSTSDKINSIKVGLGYKLGDTAHLNLGWEQVSWNLVSGGKPVERWYDLGLGFNLGNKTMLNVMWQISDYDSKGNAGFNVFGQPKAKGGLITTQLSVKF